MKRQPVAAEGNTSAQSSYPTRYPSAKNSLPLSFKESGVPWGMCLKSSKAQSLDAKLCHTIRANAMARSSSGAFLKQLCNKASTD